MISRLRTRVSRTMDALGLNRNMLLASRAAGEHRAGMMRGSRALAALVVALGLAGSALARAQTDACPKGRDPFGKCRDEAPPPLPLAPVTRTEIVSEPQGTEVIEGERRLGITPLALTQKELPPGAHEIVLRAQGQDVARQTITVVKGKVNHFEFPLPVVSVVARDDTTRGALLSVDDRVIGNLPVQNLVLSVGKHVFKLEREDYETATITQELPRGSPPQGIAFPPLRPEMGEIVVGEAGDDQLVGVPVYLDGDPWGSSDPKDWGIRLGNTPTTPQSVRAGEHLVTLRPEGVEPRSLRVRVQAKRCSLVPVDLPAFGFRARLSNRPTSAPVSEEEGKRAERTCKPGQTDGCRVAAYWLLHNKSTSPSADDVSKAEKLYRTACDAPWDGADGDTKYASAAACLSLGYLRKKRGDPGATAAFSQACYVGGEQRACLYRYLSWQSVPDPTLEVGDLEQFRRWDAQKLSNVAVLGGMTAVGFSPDIAVYQDAHIEFRGKLSPRIQLLFRGMIQVRTLLQHDETSSMRQRITQGGFGAEFGVMFVPWNDNSITFRLGPSISLYGENFSSFSAGGVAMIGHAFDQHHIEFGMLLKSVPLSTHRTDAFGTNRFIETKTLLPLLGLSYGFLLM